MAIPEKRLCSQEIGIEAPASHERLLAGKTALVTGISRNIGPSIAEELAAEGVNIIGTLRNPMHINLADAVLDTITKQGVKAESVLGDITEPAEREKLRETVENSFGGKLDFLILNASGEDRNINVIANNALVDMFLPNLSNGGTIVLMQSVQGHFEPQLSKLNLIPDIYSKVAPAKNEGEKSLRLRIKEFKKKGVSFIVVCPPLVKDTSIPRAYMRYGSGDLKGKNLAASKMLGIPVETDMKSVAKKVAELLKRQDLPTGYTELFTQITGRDFTVAFEK